MSQDLIDRLDDEADLCKQEGAHEVADLLWEAAKEMKQQAAEIARLRTGDTCARMCEGAAYRIEARQLRALLRECEDDVRYSWINSNGASRSIRANRLARLKDALAEQK